jgi:hypothetical protein
MTRRIRILLGVLILAISISLLIWGFAPARRETRIQNISPSEMELPTPSSFRIDLAPELGASLMGPVQDAGQGGVSVIFTQHELAL